MNTLLLMLGLMIVLPVLYELFNWIEARRPKTHRQRVKARLEERQRLWDGIENYTYINMTPQQIEASKRKARERMLTGGNP